DDRYRLLTASSLEATESFTFDPVGNRKSGPTPQDTELAAYDHDDANRMLLGRKDTYEYDAFGNQRFRYLSADTNHFWEYSWDGDNRMIKAELKNAGIVLRTVNFKYDPFGRRIEKNVVEAVSTTTHTYVYDGEDIVLVYVNNGAATTLTHYIHGPGIDEPVAMVRGGQTYFFHADGLGSVVAITDVSRNVVQRYTYESFGELTPQNPAFENAYTYTGREWDRELGLYYYRARYYDPMEGRFISKDPIGFEGGDVNLYAYVENQSVTFNDPRGLEKGWGWGGHAILARLTCDQIYDECCRNGKKYKRKIVRNCYSFGFYATVGLPFGKGLAPVLNQTENGSHCGEKKWEEDSNDPSYGGDLGIYGRDSKSKNKWMTLSLGGYYTSYQDCRYSVIEEEEVGCCNK
ncbi:MAG: RHS repeat-associated core domain-containing protein, partial [Proteobacteria bacterium]|nr:RHS repeat-associated core domain-containing protein [Pseudomonadota bacterium]